jgi:hypothetical protein
LKSVVIIAAAAIALRAEAQLSLMPTMSERVQEGIHFQQLCFSDGGKKVTYEPPRGWSYVSESKKIILRPPGKAESRAEIEVGFPVIPPEFDEEGLKQLKAMFLRLVPKDSEKIEIVAEQKNPVLINGHESYEFIVAFINYGQRCRMSVLFANLPREQIRCKVIANPDDFEETHRRFIESLYGLQWSP